MAIAIEFLYLFYCLVSVVVFITMSALAGAALRTTKTQVSTHSQLKRVSLHAKRQGDLLFFPSQQATVVMTIAPTEMPVE